jgi:phenylalanyl-tRNA synthetase beta chain
VLQRNQSFGTTDIIIFEIGKVYYQHSAQDIDEKINVAGAVAGSAWKSAWNLPEEALDADFFLCKGIVESLLSALGMESVSFEAAEEPLLHPTRAAKVLIGGKPVGIMGEAAPAIRESLDLRERSYVYELDFQALMNAAPKVLKYHRVPRYPALSRHIAVVVSDEVTYEGLEQIIRRSGEGVIEDVQLLEVFKGEQIGAGRSALTISMLFRSLEKTLTDEEVNAVLGEVKGALTAELEASFR